MKCENCLNEHDGSIGSGRFCSIKCSRSFSTKNSRLQRNKKISESLKGKKPNKDCEKLFKCEFCGKLYAKKTSLGGHASRCLSSPTFIKALTNREKQKEDLLILDYEVIPGSLKREKIFRDQQGKCNHCGLDEWLGQKITLELEHKDGDHYNDNRSNVELLCPNCHSLTHTWRGRNKNAGKSGKRVDDKDLIDALNCSPSIRQALIKVGLSPKGGNYFRAKNLKNQMGR
jgi:hypothetical protein